MTALIIPAASFVVMPDLLRMFGHEFTLYEWYVAGIAACVLGGCSLRGGEGSVLGIILGAALILVLQNLVNLLGVPSSLNFAVMGSVILLGVVTDQIVKQRKESRLSSADSE